MDKISSVWLTLWRTLVCGSYPSGGHPFSTFPEKLQAPKAAPDQEGLLDFEVFASTFFCFYHPWEGITPSSCLYLLVVSCFNLDSPLCAMYVGNRWAMWGMGSRTSYSSYYRRDAVGTPSAGKVKSIVTIVISSCMSLINFFLNICLLLISYFLSTFYWLFWVILLMIFFSPSAAGPHTIINGKEVVNFSSANYLGLIGDKKLLVRSGFFNNFFFLLFCEIKGLA